MLNITKSTSFSAHRSGWNYVMNNLMRFNSFDKIMLDDFVDITFGYRYRENQIKQTIPYTKPWIGFIHHPPKICPWYEDDYREQIDIHNYMRTYEFSESMEKCEGIFVLSDYLKNYLKKNFDCFKKVPIFSLKHPTSFDSLLLWDYNKFRASGGRGTRVINVGYFLRTLSTIYTAKFQNKRVERILMPSSLEYAIRSLKNEISYKNLTIDKSLVKIMSWQDHKFFDKALEQSLVLLDLYDTSCNNAIIESIVRNTPLLINKHPATIEYLGKNYPLYTNFKKPINVNNEKIYEAHEYIKNLDKTDLSIEYFCDEFNKNVNQIKGRNKPKSRSRKISKNKNILCGSSNFGHRFGWPFVTYEMKKYFNKKAARKSYTDLYVSDFTEHVFKNFFSHNTKYINIDNHNYSGVRGKTLINLQGSDFFIQNKTNEIYKWSNDQWVKENYTKVKDAVAFAQHSTYQNNPWIGMLHNPVNMPNWFGYSQNINSILQKEEFIDALSNCKLLITFSKNQKHDIVQAFKKHNIKNPKIVSLKHPIPELPDTKYFDPNKYFANKKIMQIGYWQRNIHRFLNQKFIDHKKYLFFSDKYCSEILNLEHMVSPLSKNISTNKINDICKTIDYYEKETVIEDITIIKTNKIQYDKYLKSGIIFSEYYDVAASNTILESLIYKTPILTNRTKSSEEYLGKNYPMFYEHPNQIEKILRDENLIIDTHQYLKDLNTENMSINNFLKTLDNYIAKI